MKKAILVVAVLMLLASSLWADGVITGNFLKLGWNSQGGLWSPADVVGMQYDPTGTGTFTAASDWLHDAGVGQRPDFFWAVKINTGMPGIPVFGNQVNGIDRASGSQSAMPLGGFTNVTTLTNHDLTWTATYAAGPAGAVNQVTIVRELKFDTLNPFFTYTTTVDNSQSSLNLTGVYTAFGLNPDPGAFGAVTYNTLTGLTINAASAAFGDTVPTFHLGIPGATPNIQSADNMDAQFLFNGGVPVNDGNGDYFTALGYELTDSGIGSTPGVLRSGAVIGASARYSFTQENVTPELGTFALMGLSMLPMAGLALRRRRKSA